MKNKQRAIMALLVAIFTAAVLAIIGLGIWVNIEYANVPISEVPLWVAWLLFD